jgi:hypothetical protein
MIPFLAAGRNANKIFCGMSSGQLQASFDFKLL